MKRTVIEYPGGVLVAFGLSALLAGILMHKSSMVAGVLVGVGSALSALGLRELLEFYASTAALECELQVDELGGARRALLLVYNRGNASAKGVRAVLSIDAKPDELRNMLAPCKGGKASVNPNNPIVDGELLPWAEGAYEVSIPPHQYAKLPLFELYKEGGGYVVEVCGEQGRAACLRLSGDEKLAVEVYISGDNIRKPLEVRLQVAGGAVYGPR